MMKNVSKILYTTASLAALTTATMALSNGAGVTGGAASAPFDRGAIGASVDSVSDIDMDLFVAVNNGSLSEAKSLFLSLVPNPFQQDTNGYYVALMDAVTAGHAGIVQAYLVPAISGVSVDKKNVFKALTSNPRSSTTQGIQKPLLFAFERLQAEEEARVAGGGAAGGSARY